MAYVDTSVIQGYQPVELPDQGNMLLKALQLQNARGQNQLQTLQIGKDQQSADETNALRRYLSDPSTSTLDSAAMRAGVSRVAPIAGQTYLKGLLDTTKTQGEIDTSATALALKKRDAVDQAVGSLSALGANVTHQDVYGAVRGLVNSKILTLSEAQADLADLPQDPSQLPAWLAKSQQRGLTPQQQITRNDPTLMQTDGGIVAAKKDGSGGSYVYPSGAPSGTGLQPNQSQQSINQPYVGRQPAGNFAGDPQAILAGLQRIQDPNDRAAALRAFQNQLAGANPSYDASGTWQGAGAQGPVSIGAASGPPQPNRVNGIQQLSGLPLGAKREEVVYHNDPMTGAVMSLPKYAAPGSNVTAGPVGGDMPSGKLSASDQAVVDQIGKYQMAVPSGQLLRTPRGAQILGALAEQYPNFDATEFPARQKAARDFTTGVQGNALRSVSVASDHLDQLAEAGEALRNGNLQAVNKVANFFNTQTGGTAQTSFNAIKQIVGDEVLKAVIGGGAGGVTDRAELAAQLKDASTPDQLSSVIRQYKALMNAQKDALMAQYENSTGRTDAATKFNFSRKGGTSAPTANGWSIEKVN